MRFWGVCLGLCVWLLGFNTQAQEEGMRLKLSIENQDVIIRLQQNSATEQFVKMLPAQFEFRDFAGEEKISNFPQPISLEGAPRGMIATAGKLFIYAPWKNFGIFYKTHDTRPDNNLIELGEVESGLNYLSQQGGDFRAQIEVIK